MENINAIVDQLVADIDIPEDVPVMYEVWAIGYNEEDMATEADLLLATFDDPDQAVRYAKGITAADVIEAAEDDCYACFDEGVCTIHVEVETVVVSDEDGAINIGTIYKNTLELFEDLPPFIVLEAEDYSVIEETGCIEVPCDLLEGYHKNDIVEIIFAEEEDQVYPIEYKIIFKTTDGKFICEFAD